MWNNSRDTNNSLRFESSTSKIFAVCHFAVKALYFPGTTPHFVFSFSKYFKFGISVINSSKEVIKRTRNFCECMTNDLKFLWAHDHLTRHDHRLSFYICQLHIYCVQMLLLDYLDALLVFLLYKGSIYFHTRDELW